MNVGHGTSLRVKFPLGYPLAEAPMEAWPMDRWMNLGLGSEQPRFKWNALMAQHPPSKGSWKIAGNLREAHKKPRLLNSAGILIINSRSPIISSWMAKNRQVGQII